MKKLALEAGKMAQTLGIFFALPEDLTSSPSTHVEVHNCL